MGPTLVGGETLRLGTQQIGKGRNIETLSPGTNAVTRALRGKKGIHCERVAGIKSILAPTLDRKAITS